ncbi:MAG: hypothetical protein WCW31_05880 [Patescibacteria group bacterium]|jgi:hypothetical protein
MRQYQALPELAYDFKIKSIRSPGLKLRDHCYVGIRLKLEQDGLRAKIVFSSDTLARACADTSQPLSPLDFKPLTMFAIPVTKFAEKDFDPCRALCAFLETTLSQTGTLLITLSVSKQENTILTFEHPIYRGSISISTSVITKYFDADKQPSATISTL